MQNIVKKLRFTSNCISSLSFILIARAIDQNNGNVNVVFTSISEEEEHKLERGETISIVRNGRTFTVHDDVCYCYGELDLSPNSKDIQTFEELDWFRNMNVKQFVQSEYDYIHHSIVSDLKGGRWFDTSNIKSYLPYLHGCIGKPKRIVIFREYVDIFALRKAKAKEYYNNNKTDIMKQRTKYRQKKQTKKKVEKLSKITFNFK